MWRASAQARLHARGTTSLAPCVSMSAGPWTSNKQDEDSPFFFLFGQSAFLSNVGGQATTVVQAASSGRGRERKNQQWGCRRISGRHDWIKIVDQDHVIRSLERVGGNPSRSKPGDQSTLGASKLPATHMSLGEGHVVAVITEAIARITSLDAPMEGTESSSPLALANRAWLGQYTIATIYFPRTIVHYCSSR